MPEALPQAGKPIGVGEIVAGAIGAETIGVAEGIEAAVAGGHEFEAVLAVEEIDLVVVEPVVEPVAAEEIDLVVVEPVVEPVAAGLVAVGLAIGPEGHNSGLVGSVAGLVGLAGKSAEDF